MGIFQSGRQGTSVPHAHGDGSRCPTCEQPIGQDLVRKIAARQREQYDAAFAKAQADAADAAQAQITAAQSEARQAAEAALTAKLSGLQGQLAEAEQARKAVGQKLAAIEATKEAEIAARLAEMRQTAETAAAAQVADIKSRLTQAEAACVSAAEEMATLKAAQAETVEKRVQEIQDSLTRQKEDLQREKNDAILSANAKVLKLQAELADMQRKLEGKSANEHGEGSEIDLYEALRSVFEGDRIQRVPKGVNGADVIHEVVHNGKICGKIVYDSKNRNAWQNEFVSKLRADKIAQAADHAILSSNKFPRDTAQVHYQDGIIVALPARVVAIVHLLRDQVVRMHELRVSKEGREQKSMALYAFITSEHCRQLLDQVETQAGRMLDLDTKEQEAHRRLWDQRKKLINAVQKARSDLSFEIDRIIGTAGNGPEDEIAA